MGIDIDIITPKGAPEMSETVSSFARCPGNIMMASKDLGFPRLDHCEDDAQRMQALHAIIDELNKGEEGVFNMAYWKECDERWSQGREWKHEVDELYKMREEHLQRMLTMTRCATVDHFVARIVRERNLKHAERFYLLFRAGYTITWTP